MARSQSVIEVILKGTDQSMSASLKGATRETGGLVAGLRSLHAGYLAAAAAAAGTVAGLRAVVSESIASAREIQSFNVRLGASVEGLQQLKVAAQLSNVAFSQVTIGMQRMTRRISEAAQGMGEAQGALKELGIDAASLSRMLPDEQLQVVAQRLSQVESQSDKVRLAFKLFDSEGVGLIQMFDELGSRRTEDVPLLSSEHVRILDGIGDKWDVIAATAGNYAKITLAKVVSALFDMRDEVDRAQAALRQGTDLMSLPAGTRAAQEAALQAAEQASKRWAAAAEASAIDLEVKVRQKEAAQDLRNLMAIAESIFADPVVIRATVEPPPSSEMIATLTRVADEIKESLGGGEVTTLRPVDIDGQPIRDLGDDAQRAAAKVDELGAAIETVTTIDPTQSRIQEWLSYTESEAANLGATMVDVTFQFADAWGNAMADAITGATSFAEAAKAAFRDFVRVAIAEINKLIARMVIAGIIKTFTGGIVPIPGGGGGSPVGTDIGDGVVVSAANYTGNMTSQPAESPAMAYARSAAPTIQMSAPQIRSTTMNVNVSTVLGTRAEAQAVARQVVMAAREAGALA